MITALRFGTITDPALVSTMKTAEKGNPEELFDSLVTACKSTILKPEMTVSRMSAIPQRSFEKAQLLEDALIASLDGMTGENRYNVMRFKEHVEKSPYSLEAYPNVAAALVRAVARTAVAPLSETDFNAQGFDLLG